MNKNVIQSSLCNNCGKTGHFQSTCKETKNTKVSKATEKKKAKIAAKAVAVESEEDNE